MASWLDKAVLYEIYPQSFYDTNSDGIGDLQGIIERLDYVASLGCNGIWLNPCFVSPFSDAGYDVSDYCSIAPRYGTNDDMKRLIEAAKARGIKIILDLVPGHTSIEHPWFKESMKAEKNEYSNRYIVTSVEYRLSKTPVFTLTYGPLKGLADQPGLSMTDIRNTIIDTRNGKLPNPDETGSVGSFFKNPVILRQQFETLKQSYPAMPHYPAADGRVKVPAGWLIENAGLKGFAIGGALVYPKQCLVIANGGTATPDDVVALYKHVTTVIEEKYGITLQPEANII